MTHPRRLLRSIERQIVDADPVEAECLRAQYIGYLAGYGRIDEAKSKLLDLRRRHSASTHPIVGPWVIFADSLVDRAAADHDSSLIKMRRAHALSRGGNLNELQALTSAWLAHIYWNLQDVDLTVSYAREALALSSQASHAAIIRVSLVIGEGLLIGRNEALGQSWYVKARDLSQKIGDELSLSALIFNLTSVRLMLLRQDVLSSGSSCIGLTHVLASQNSENFDKIMGIKMDARTPIQQAKVLSLQGKAEKALELYAKHAREPKLLATRRERCEWLADESWCLARLGRNLEAVGVAQTAQDAVVKETHIDDLAAIYSRLARTYDLVGDVESASRFAGVADALWIQYKSLQLKFSRSLATLRPEGEVL